jgi:hypothetical protein
MPVGASNRRGSVVVEIENVVLSAPLGTRLSVQLITATFPASTVHPTVTVSTALTANAALTGTVTPSLVMVHAVAASATNSLGDVTMVTLPPLGNDVPGVNVTVRSPSYAEREALPHVTEPE